MWYKRAMKSFFSARQNVWSTLGLLPFKNRIVQKFLSSLKMDLHCFACLAWLGLACEWSVHECIRNTRHLYWQTTHLLRCTLTHTVYMSTYTPHTLTHSKKRKNRDKIWSTKKAHTTEIGPTKLCPVALSSSLLSWKSSFAQSSSLWVCKIALLMERSIVSCCWWCELLSNDPIPPAIPCDEEESVPPLERYMLCCCFCWICWFSLGVTTLPFLRPRPISFTGGPPPKRLPNTDMPPRRWCAHRHWCKGMKPMKKREKVWPPPSYELLKFQGHPSL